MPTSKARKRKMVGRQMYREKATLRTKYRLGLNIQSRSLQKKTTITNALAALTTCLKKTVKFPEEGACDQIKITECKGEINAEHNAMITNKIASDEKLINLSQTETQPQIIKQDISKIAVTKLPNKPELISIDLSQAEGNKLDSNISSPEDHTHFIGSGGKFCSNVLNSSICTIQNISSFPLVVTRSILQQIKRLLSGLMASSMPIEEVEILKQRISNAEHEIQILKQMMNKKNENALVDGASKQNCIPMLCTSNEADDNSRQPKSAPPAPPPPPPPPPPLPIPVFGITIAKKRSRKSESSDSNPKKLKNTQITADQILKVKLKKVSFEKENAVSRKSGRTVTIQDLKGVKLRKTTARNIDADKENMMTPLQNISKKLSESLLDRCGLSEKRTPLKGYNLRKTLRKVNVIRSPGGTPLVKSRREFGEGVTPLLTEALRRKFKNTKPPSVENTPDF